MCPKKLGHKDARVHYANLKQQTATNSKPHNDGSSLALYEAEQTDQATMRNPQRVAPTIRSVSSGPNSVSGTS
ncbi:hypothetical protein GCM10018965_054000 [Nonomuraea roseola]